MNTTPIIAIYAAAVATGSLGWNVYSSYLKRTRVTVTADVGASHSLPGGTTHHALRVNVHNRSPHPITISGFAVLTVPIKEPEYARSGQKEIDPGSISLPVTITQNDRAAFHFKYEDSPVIATSNELRGWLQRGCVIAVVLDTGAKFRTKPVKLKSETHLEEI